MASDKGNLFLRNDTIFGVCQGLGEDLGIHPNVFRIALAVGITVAPFWMVGIYAAMAVVVLVSRLLFPNRKVAAAQEEAARVVTSEPAVANSEERVLEAA